MSVTTLFFITDHLYVIKKIYKIINVKIIHYCYIIMFLCYNKMT
jgi:hypothetical protein